MPSSAPPPVRSSAAQPAGAFAFGPWAAYAVAPAANETSAAQRSASAAQRADVERRLDLDLMRPPGPCCTGALSRSAGRRPYVGVPVARDATFVHLLVRHQTAPR